MHRLRRRLQRIVWIALVAMLGAVAAPAAVNALATGGASSRLTDICTAAGTVMLTVRSDGLGASGSEDVPGGMGSSAAGGSHCALCGHPLPFPGMPAPDSVVRVCPRQAPLPPSLLLHAPRRPAVWVSARPRAPPVAPA